jgi:hypothetical protein
MALGWGPDNPRDEYYMRKNVESMWGNPNGLIGLICSVIIKLFIKTWFIWIPLLIVGSILGKCESSLEPKSQQTQIAQQVQPFAYVNAAALNMRSGPSAQAGVVTLLHKDDRVQIIENASSSNWIKVRFGDFEGYVNADYLEP